MSNDPLAEPPVDESMDPSADEHEPDMGPAGMDSDAIALENERLREEVNRLRTEVEAARRSQYRRTALGMAVLGGVAVLGAAVFVDVRSQLLAIASIGFFAAVLTYFITPEQFVAASVGERLYRTLATNEDAIVEDLELRGDPVVVPTSGTAAPARLFVPESEPPASFEEIDLRAPFVTDDVTGLALEPSGVGLYEPLTNATNGLPSSPADICQLTAEALTDQFELVDKIDLDIDATDGRASFAITGSTYGDIDQFDHPVVSLPATALAVSQETVVSIQVDDGGDAVDWIVTYRWD